MNAGPSVRSVAVLAAALAWLGASAAQSEAQNAPLRALSSNGVRAAVEVLAPQCERSVGRAVEIEYGTSASIRQRISGGEPVDFAFITTPVVAELAADGHLAAGSITPLGRAGIGVGIRAGARRYEIGTAAAIRETLLAAKSVTFAREGASRVHLERMFEQLGIAAEMQAKTLLEPGSVQAAAKVAAGEAELLLTLVSEILPEDGVERLGPLPAEFQSYISFDAALGAHPKDAVAARAFVACVAAPAAVPTFAEKGIER
jgi:molybdate transport system substrate-binding protein